MAYSKPVIVAQNGAQGACAAGCPAQGTASDMTACKKCERSE
jgi:hypothetical protein